jgi:hypothetical protein
LPANHILTVADDDSVVLIGSPVVFHLELQTIIDNVADASSHINEASSDNGNCPFHDYECLIPTPASLLPA